MAPTPCLRTPSTHPLAPPDNIDAAKKLLKQYTDKDMEFSINQDGFNELVAATFAGDVAPLSDAARDAIFAAFDTDGKSQMSVLDVICGFAIVCDASAADKAGGASTHCGVPTTGVRGVRGRVGGASRVCVCPSPPGPRAPATQPRHIQSLLPCVPTRVWSFHFPDTFLLGPPLRPQTFN